MRDDVQFEELISPGLCIAASSSPQEQPVSPDPEHSTPPPRAKMVKKLTSRRNKPRSLSARRGNLSKYFDSASPVHPVSSSSIVKKLSLSSRPVLKGTATPRGALTSTDGPPLLSLIDRAISTSSDSYLCENAPSVYESPVDASSTLSLLGGRHFFKPRFSAPPPPPPAAGSVPDLSPSSYWFNCSSSPLPPPPPPTQLGDVHFSSSGFSLFGSAPPPPPPPPQTQLRNARLHSSGFSLFGSAPPPPPPPPQTQLRKAHNHSSGFSLFGSVPPLPPREENLAVNVASAPPVINQAVKCVDLGSNLQNSTSRLSSRTKEADVMEFKDAAMEDQPVWLDMSLCKWLFADSVVPELICFYISFND